MSGKADISSLANTLSSLGYGKVVTGSYVGDGTGYVYEGESYNPRSITLPVAPNSGIIIIGADSHVFSSPTGTITSSYSNIYYIAPNCYGPAYAYSYVSGSYKYSYTCKLINNILYVISGGTTESLNSVSYDGPNLNSIAYYYLIF